MDVDLFSDEVLNDPYPTLKRLRDVGGVVYLDKYDLWALPRYETTRFALANHGIFTSNHGVAMSDTINVELMPDNMLHDDGETHRRLRSALQPMLSVRALQKLAEEVDGEAERLVGRVLRNSSFDAMKDIAEILPVSVVARLIGLPEDRRMKLLDWADSVFMAFGPMNDRTVSALPRLQELFEYLAAEAAPGNLAPGSWGAAIYAAAERGELLEEDCLPLMLALVGAGMETTISVIGSLFLLFAENPGEWDKVRANPDLAERAFAEALRVETPAHYFTRVALSDFEADGTVIPAGARALIMYASANRDERKWPDPDVFDVERKDVNQHLAFGYGLHTCIGQPLARIQSVAVIKALVPRVERFHAGHPTRRPNHLSWRMGSLPMTITRASAH